MSKSFVPADDPRACTPERLGQKLNPVKSLKQALDDYDAAQATLAAFHDNEDARILMSDEYSETKDHIAEVADELADAVRMALSDTTT